MRLRLIGRRAKPGERLGVSFIGQRDHRHVGARRGGDARGDVDVLGQQAEREPGPVTAGQHLRVEDPADEGPAGGGVDDIDHGPGVQAEPLADDERLGGHAGRGGGDDVVQRLHRVPAAQPAGRELPGRVAEHAQHLLSRGHVGRRAADHDGQFAGDRPRHAARHRRVHHPHAQRLEARGEQQRVGRVRRAHLDQQRAVPQGGADPPAEHRVPHDRAVRQHRHHEARGRERVRGSGGDGAGMLGGEPVLLRGLDVADDQPEAGRVQVPRHRPAHVAQAHEAHGHLLFRNAHRYRRSLAATVSPP